MYIVKMERKAKKEEVMYIIHVHTSIKVERKERMEIYNFVVVVDVNVI